MRSIQVVLGAGLGLVVAGLVTAGCGAGGPKLEGAVYADQIPVYVPAQVTESVGGTSTNLDGSGATYSLSWWLETRDSMTRVEAWYDQQLPNAEKDREYWGSDMVTVYTWSPQGGEPGEELSVVISRENIQITESVNHRRSTG